MTRPLLSPELEDEVDSLDLVVVVLVGVLLEECLVVDDEWWVVGLGSAF